MAREQTEEGQAVSEELPQALLHDQIQRVGHCGQCVWTLRAGSAMKDVAEGQPRWVQTSDCGGWHAPKEGFGPWYVIW